MWRVQDRRWVWNDFEVVKGINYVTPSDLINWQGYYRVIFPDKTWDKEFSFQEAAVKNIDRIK